MLDSILTDVSNMDKFGRSSLRKQVLPVRWNTLYTDKGGNYNFHNKRLYNVNTPINDLDCANKKYVDDLFRTLSYRLSEEVHLMVASSINEAVTKNTNLLKIHMNDKDMDLLSTNDI